MKIYKFRQLITGQKDERCDENNSSDFCRLKEIIETGKFWCSNFWELNDSMEGIFSIKNGLGKKISKIYEEKKQYKICSFSGINGFNNALMWGYYSSGFKGVAIEIEINNNEVEKVDCNEKGVVLDNDHSSGLVIEQIEYLKNIFDISTSIKYSSSDFIAKEIFTKKLEIWKYEDEFRFLIKSNKNKHKIGKITAIYFGDPYSGLYNTRDFNENKKLKKFREFKKDIIEFVKGKNKNIKCFNVEIVNNRIKKCKKNLCN